MRLSDELKQLASAYRSGKKLALLFDYDGTLAPIVIHPALAQCPPATLELLGRFADMPRVLVGIISSRELVDLQTMVNLPKLIYAGTSGLELEINGVVTIHPAANQHRSTLRQAAKSLVAVVERFAGGWIELKRFAMTIHYRNVNRDDTPFLKHSVISALTEFGQSLTIVDASMALEVYPAIGWSKGDSLRQILNLLPEPAVPFYAGNDTNDAEALQFAEELGGIAVGIGPSAPAAAPHHLADTESLVDLLNSLHSSLVGKVSQSVY